MTVIARRLGSAFVVVAAVLAAVAYGPVAEAFERTSGPEGGKPAMQAVPGIEIAPDPTQNGAGLELTVPDVGGQDKASAGGGGLSIPGLGVLPKLDFGLQLLYGAPDQGPVTPDIGATKPDALTVHGEVKKTF